MARLLTFGIIFLVSISCKEKKDEVVANDTAGYVITTENWPEKLAIKANAQTILIDWIEYNEIEKSFDALYTVENREDLSLTIDNLIERQKALAESTYPEKFDNPQVKSRQKVFKTYMLKVKGDLIYRIDPQESVLQMLEAYNALRNQFNVIANNTLDTKLILEE